MSPDEKLSPVITVFSAPNYCGRYGNKAAVLQLGTHANKAWVEQATDTTGTVAPGRSGVKWQQFEAAVEPESSTLSYEHNSSVNPLDALSMVCPYMPTTFRDLVKCAQKLGPAVDRSRGAGGNGGNETPGHPDSQGHGVDVGNLDESATGPNAPESPCKPHHPVGASVRSDTRASDDAATADDTQAPAPTSSAEELGEPESADTGGSARAAVSQRAGSDECDTADGDAAAAAAAAAAAQAHGTNFVAEMTHTLRKVAVLDPAAFVRGCEAQLSVAREQRSAASGLSDLLDHGELLVRFQDMKRNKK